MGNTTAERWHSWEVNQHAGGQHNCRQFSFLKEQVPLKKEITHPPMLRVCVSMGWGSAPCLPLSISIHVLLLQLFVFFVLGPQFCCQFWHSESETKANSPVLCKTTLNHHTGSQSKPEMLVLSMQGARKGPEEFIHLAFRLHLFLISENLVSLTFRKGIFQYRVLATPQLCFAKFPSNRCQFVFSYSSQT